MDLSSLNGVMIILGPILLAAVLLWAVLHNRGSRREVEKTEEATRRNYDAEAKHDGATDYR